MGETLAVEKRGTRHAEKGAQERMRGVTRVFTDDLHD